MTTDQSSVVICPLTANTIVGSELMKGKTIPTQMSCQLYVNKHSKLEILLSNFKKVFTNIFHHFCKTKSRVVMRIAFSISDFISRARQSSVSFVFLSSALFVLVFPPYFSSLPVLIS